MRLYALLGGALVLALLALPASRVGADAARWRKLLATTDLDELHRTIEGVAERGDASAALPLLEAGVTTAHPHIAVACGDALAGLDPEVAKDAKVKKYIKKQLKAKDVEHQKNLARILGAWGIPAVDAPLGHLASGRREAELQAEALFMCGSVKAFTPKTFPTVYKSIGGGIEKGRTDDVLCAAASAAGRLRITDFAENLISVAKKARGDYAGLYSVWALRQMEFEGGIGPFLHVLGSNPKKTTRQACLKAVTELSRLEDVDTLLSLSRNSKKDYRDAAVLALGRLGWRAKRKSGRKAREAAKARVVTGEEAPEAAKIPGGIPKVELDVPEKVIDRLIQLVDAEDDWEVRDAARQGLLRFGTIAQPKVQAAMPALISYSDQDTALTAIELAGLFGANRAHPELVKLALYEKDPVRRMFAARALEGVKPAEAVEEFAKVAKTGRRARDYQLAAVRALGYIRTREAYDALMKIIEIGPDSEAAAGYSEDMLRETEYALERLTGHRFGRKPERWQRWLAQAVHPFHPGVEKFDRIENRRAVVEKQLYGLTRTTERAVENGLRWLELQQHTIGTWDGNEKGFGGVIGCEPAYTGLSLLAFVGAGYNSASGKYRETIRRCTEFLAATQYYDGGFPVTGGTDQSWIYAYLIAMAIWGINESYALSGDEALAEPSQWGIDYLVRVQTAGAGWRYGPRYHQTDTSCTSWVMMTVKTAQLSGLEVSQRCLDGIDAWLEICSLDITGEEETPKDLATDYDFEVGARRYYKAFAGYFALGSANSSSLQQVSMTAVTMVCRFFQGWKRSHPFMIGASNYLSDYLPQWMKGLEKGMAIAWYHYYWYYGTLAMHQMGGRYWRAWNQKIKHMYPENQRKSPPDLAGSWDPDTAVLNGGRLFSTAMSILTLETYYRFSPLMKKELEEADGGSEKDPKKEKPGGAPGAGEQGSGEK